MKKKVALIALVLVIVAASVVALAACNNATSIEKRLVKAGFTVEEGGYVGDSQDAEMPEGLQWYLSAERVSQLTMTEDYVAVYCFEKAAQAKSYASLIKREAGADLSMQIEVKGKLIFMGPKNGVEPPMCPPYQIERQKRRPRGVFLLPPKASSDFPPKASSLGDPRCGTLRGKARPPFAARKPMSVPYLTAN